MKSVCARQSGAHDKDILLQFLVEALVLCTLGGLMGIGIGYGIQLLVGLIPGAPLKVIIQPWAVVLALAVSSASGFIFGLYPAMRARSSIRSRHYATNKAAFRTVRNG